jgi:CheY-like chemotaxis protein
MMPGMDGDEVLRQLKLNPHWTPRRVIAVSGDVSSFPRLDSLGADVCLAKPFRFDHLLEVVRDLLDRPVVPTAAGPESTTPPSTGAAEPAADPLFPKGP